MQRVNLRSHFLIFLIIDSAQWKINVYWQNGTWSIINRKLINRDSSTPPILTTMPDSRLCWGSGENTLLTKGMLKGRPIARGKSEDTLKIIYGPKIFLNRTSSTQQICHGSNQKFTYSRFTPINHNNLISVPVQRPRSLLKRPKSLSVAVINTRSLNANGFKLKDSILDLDSNFVVITESWLPQNDSVANHIIKNAFPTEFKMTKRLWSTWRSSYNAWKRAIIKTIDFTICYSVYIVRVHGETTWNDMDKAR